jgi:PEP-CTERM motif
MFRKALLTTAAAIAMFALNSVARADTVTLTGINGTGVTATVTNYSLSGNTFTFTINNTSVAPGTTGTITNIGFDLTGNRANSYSLTSSTRSGFHVAYDLNATAGAQNFVGTFDFVLMNSANGADTFGGGSVNNGIAGGASATFSVTGDFSGMTADQIARSIYARFQNVNNGGSDVAHSSGPGQVPEPMTMLLFGTGLAGLAARARKQRRNGKA